MKKYSKSFVFIILTFTGTYELNASFEPNPQFEIKQLNSIAPNLKSDEALKAKRYFFYELNPQERKSLCRKAIKHAQIEEIDSEDRFRTFSLHEDLAPELILKCNSSPTAYLRANTPSGSRITIFIEKNRYMEDPYKFHYEIVGSAISCSEELENNSKYFGWGNYNFFNLLTTECFENKIVRNDVLDRMSGAEFLQVCTAAKKRRGKEHPEPLFTRARVGEPELYKVQHPNREEERVAIKCPTQPIMLIYFRHARFHKDDIQVLFVVNGKKAVVNKTKAITNETKAITNGTEAITNETKAITMAMVKV